MLRRVQEFIHKNIILLMGHTCARLEKRHSIIFKLTDENMPPMSLTSSSVHSASNCYNVNSYNKPNTYIFQDYTMKKIDTFGHLRSAREVSFQNVYDSISDELYIYIHI